MIFSQSKHLACKATMTPLGRWLNANPLMHRDSEDMIDTKPWYFRDMTALILGSVLQEGDNLGDVDETIGSSDASIQRPPSPSPSYFSGAGRQSFVKQSRKNFLK